MSNVLQYKGYSSRIEYSVEDQILYGKIDGIADLVSFEADSIETIEKEFQDAVDDYLDFCQSIGKEPDKEFKGSFNVRMDPQTHRDLYMNAIKKNVSLNQMVQIACRSYCDQIQLLQSIDNEMERLIKYRNDVTLVKTTDPSTWSPFAQSISSSNFMYLQ